MTDDGTSNPADLLLFPLVFVLVLVLAATLLWLVRRMFPREPAPPEPVTSPLTVPEAVEHLRKAGLDTDELLGPWLAEARQGCDQETASRFN